MLTTLIIIKRAIVLLLIIIALNRLIKYIFSKKIIHTICLKLGISAISTKEMIFITASTFCTAYFFREIPDLSNPILYFAFTSPIFGIANIILNKESVRQRVARIPFFGDYITCPLATEEKVDAIKKEMKINGLDESEIDAIKKCSFTCDSCRGTDAIKIAAGWSVSNIAVPWVIRYMKILK